MQACLLRGSSLHLCLKAGQLSVVTITRRCRCCLDEVIILRVLFYINTASIIIFNKNTKGMILKLIYFCKECCYAQKNISKGGGMSNENEFFAEMHPQIAQVIGIAVMQLLVEKREPSREALIEMIQVLWQGDQVELAVELALDVLMQREE